MLLRKFLKQLPIQCSYNKTAVHISFLSYLQKQFSHLISSSKGLLLCEQIMQSPTKSFLYMSVIITIIHTKWRGTIEVFKLPAAM